MYLVCYRFSKGSRRRDLLSGRRQQWRAVTRPAGQSRLSCEYCPAAIALQSARPEWRRVPHTGSVQEYDETNVCVFSSTTSEMVCFSSVCDAGRSTASSCSCGKRVRFTPTRESGKRDHNPSHNLWASEGENYSLMGICLILDVCDNSQYRQTQVSWAH